MLSKRIQFIALLFLFSLPVIASAQDQNLVLNPSFSKQKEDRFPFWQHFFAMPSGFYYTNGNKADTAVSFIAESFGKKPKSNSYHGGGKHIMYVRLKEPLKAGTYYRVGLNIKQGDSSLILLNGLGVGFRKSNHPAFLFGLSQVNKSEDWISLEGVYLAKGGEHYLYIGKFSEEQTDYAWNDKFPRKKYKSTWERHQDAFDYKARYVIDDVSVEKLPFRPSFNPFEKFSPDAVFFETAKYDLPEASKSYLLMLASFLRSNDDLLITVEGFADKRGNDDDNLQLSKQRAIRVAEFLLQHGVAKNRIKPLWHGSKGADPSPGNYHLDRKVQFEIISAP